jgi:hypothetical protein
MGVGLDQNGALELLAENFPEFISHGGEIAAVFLAVFVGHVRPPFEPCE